MTKRMRTILVSLAVAVAAVSRWTVRLKPRAVLVARAGGEAP